MAKLKNFIGQMGKAVVFALSWVLAFPAGLLIFNPINIIVMSFKRSWRNRLADVMEDNGPVSLAAKIMAVVTFALLLVAMFVILNPFIVWVMALIAPKWVAETCYGDLSEGFWSMLLGIPLSLQRWIGHLLPWRCRKHFVEERFCRYSSKDRMRLTLEEPSHFFSLADKEKEMVFCYFKTSAEQRMEWVKKRAELTETMFSKLCTDGSSAVKKYVEVKKGLDSSELRTLCYNASAEELFEVISSLKISDNELIILAKYPRHFAVLLALLMKKGCGKATVMNLKSIVSRESGYCQDAPERLLETLNNWRQKGEVTQTADKMEMFAEFCEGEAEICPDALKKMTVEQYRVYKGLGKNLPGDVLRYFIANGSEEMVKAIFELEDELDVAKDIVNSSPELHLLLLEIRAKREEKKSEAAKAEE